MCYRRLPVLALFLSLVVAAPSRGEPPSEEELFAAHVKKLDPGNSSEDRLAALEWLLKNCARPPAAKALPAIERCLKGDADAEVRSRAAEALGMTAFQIKPRICPKGLIEALFDRDEDVRSMAMGVSGMFKEFAPGSMEMLLKAARESDVGVRGSALHLLAYAAPEEEKVRRLIRDSRDDKDFRVRNDAHIAWFKITGKLEDIVPYWFRVQVEHAGLPDLPADSPEEAKRERVMWNLILLGSVVGLQREGEQRTDDVVRLLLAGLEDKSAIQRRGAALWIGNLASYYVTFPGVFRATLPTVDRLGEDDRPPLPKVLVRLGERKVDEVLSQLQKNDPEPDVRAAAASALKELAGLKKKEPPVPPQRLP